MMNVKQISLTDKLLRPEEVAEILGMSVFTVKKYCRDGMLKNYKIGGHRRIAASDLEAFLLSNLQTTKVH